MNRDTYYRTLTKAELAIVGVSSWRRAKGVKWHRDETNDALAERDYSVECQTGSDPIILVEGYWIWWCASHHQPLARCECQRLAGIVNKVEEALSEEKLRR